MTNLVRHHRILIKSINKQEIELLLLNLFNVRISELFNTFVIQFGSTLTFFKKCYKNNLKIIIVLYLDWDKLFMLKLKQVIQKIQNYL